MGTPRLGSILLGSTRPKDLKEWYVEALAPDYSGDGPIDLGGFGLVIEERDDVSETNAEAGRFILNFHVDNIDAVRARLDRVGVRWLVPVEDRPMARIGTFVDPDGNYLQLIQFKPGHDE